MTDIIVIAVVVVIAFFAVRYIVRAKKSGKKCIGCPYADSCASNKKETSSSGCCHCGEKKE